MMNMEKRPGLALVIASKLRERMGKGKEEEEKDTVSIAKDLLDAIEEKDAKAFARLLESFISACE